MSIYSLFTRLIISVFLVLLAFSGEAQIFKKKKKVEEEKKKLDSDEDIISSRHGNPLVTIDVAKPKTVKKRVDFLSILKRKMRLMLDIKDFGRRRRMSESI